MKKRCFHSARRSYSFRLHRSAWTGSHRSNRVLRKRESEHLTLHIELQPWMLDIERSLLNVLQSKHPDNGLAFEAEFTPLVVEGAAGHHAAAGRKGKF